MENNDQISKRSREAKPRKRTRRSKSSSSERSVDPRRLHSRSRKHSAKRKKAVKPATAATAVQVGEWIIEQDFTQQQQVHPLVENGHNQQQRLPEQPLSERQSTPAPAGVTAVSGAPQSSQTPATCGLPELPTPQDVSGNATSVPGMPNNLLVNISEFSQLLNSIMRPNVPSIAFDKNIIPVYDPSQKNQKIERWLSKVNECAKIYHWTDEQTIHYALPKLGGHAKKWYEGLQSILLTWAQWQEHLIRAFPSETNYGTMLTEMLDRRMRVGESIDEYYYEKMMLLNSCEITEKRAVDCLVHGIEDRTIRAGASSGRFQEPEDLLKLLKDLCKETNLKPYNKSRMSTNASIDIVCHKCKKPGHRAIQCRSSGPEVTCYNCKEKGHVSSNCTKPLIKCDTCHRLGHKSAECYQNKKLNINKGDKEVKAMVTQSIKADSKYLKNVTINGVIESEAFVDFGSDCTLIRKDIVDKHSLAQSNENLPVIRGFGNGVYTPMGKTRITLKIGEITADLDAFVVETAQLSTPLLIGQDFTERPDVLVIKTNDRLDILKRDIPGEIRYLPNENNEKIVLRISSDVTIDKFDYVECSHEEKTSCDILVESSTRQIANTAYCVVGGVYGLHEGSCKIAVYNPTSQPVPLISGRVFTRARVIRKCNFSETKGSVACNKITNQADLVPFDRSQVNINPNLTEEQTVSVVTLINSYRHCFAENLAELGCTDEAEMVIELNDSTPVSYRPYRLSYVEREKVREMVRELVDHDIVEESSSSYASPIILVTKKTGGYRLCVDFRALNRKTVKDHFPLPRIDDLLDMLSGNRFYTSLDLASGYYQIPIRPDCRHLTAFITPDGLYQFKKMPFGLVNSPSVFQRTINKILGNSRFKSTLAYMDDILIPGKDFDEEYKRLKETLVMLQNAGLTLNLKKCNFFQEQLEYLGYEISEEGIKPGKAKINAVDLFPTPSNVHEVRQFVGLASYFRKFIRNFATVAKPLTDLTRKDCEWAWGVEQQEAFTQLKTALVQRPLLGLYSPNFETHLHTDASKHGLAGILLQKESESSPLKPIAYFSRKTTVDEQNYHAYELETLAVIASLQRFRVYLLGIVFTLVTDCIAVRDTFTKRDLVPRIARWWIAIQEFKFQIEYKPGQYMSHVDALSRNPLPCEFDVTPDPVPSVFKITQDDWLLTLQLKDHKLQHIRNILEDKEYHETKKNYIIKNNKLFRLVDGQPKWVVPKSARFQLCKLNHDDIGHFGVEKTLNKISKDFWFPKMKRFVTKYVRHCIECAYAKEPSGPKEGLLHPIHKVDKPFDTFHVDHLGPFVTSAKGNSYLLVLVDGFTKFCLLRPLRDLKSRSTIRALEEIFTTFAYPYRLISDQGSTFTSKEFELYCKESKIRHVLNAVASPRANGQVERYNRTVLDSLTAFTDKIGEKKWDTVLGKLQWGLNNTLNKGIGKAPSEALYGIQLVNRGENIFAEVLAETRQPGSLQEIRDEISSHIEKDQLEQKSRYDKTKLKARIYKIGDLVKILKPAPHNDGKSKKLLAKFTGPFKITKILGNDRYEVSSIEGTTITQKNYCNTWAADRIKPWITTYDDDNSSSESSGQDDN